MTNQEELIQALESKLAKAVTEIRCTLDRLLLLEGELEDTELSRMQANGMIGAIRKTLKELGENKC